MKSLTLALALALAACTSVAALADGNTGMIRGVVRDIHGTPIAGAPVYWSNPGGLDKTTTDRFGRFQFFGVVVGYTNVFSTATGYTPHCRKGWVSANQAVDLVIQLPPGHWFGNFCTPFPLAGAADFYSTF